MEQLTRRTLLAMLGAVPTPAVAARAYNVDATVVLLGIPIWRRPGVGRGRLAVGSREEQGQKVFRAEFSGGAIPERANGIRNAGLLNETVIERSAIPVEANYFGLMTSFTHESAEEARKALANRGARTCQYSAVQGVNTPGKARSVTAKFVAEQPVTPDRISELAGRGREEVGRSGAPWKEVAWPGHASGTLLYSLWLFATGEERARDYEYAYASFHYTLQADKQPDRSTGDELAAKGLTQHPERIMRMRGRISRRDVSGKTPFTIWYEAGPAPTLLRFVWQPRAFIRLRFEASLEKA